MKGIQFEPFSVPANILLFILLWIGVCKRLSVFGGWKMLAGEYQTKSAFEGRKLWVKSAKLADLSAVIQKKGPDANTFVIN